MTQLSPLSVNQLCGLNCFYVCRTVIWDKNNTSPQGLQDVAAALEKYVSLSPRLYVCMLVIVCVFQFTVIKL